MSTLNMPVVFSAIFSFLGSAVTSLFGFKGEQAKTVQNALDVLKSVNATDATSTTAAAGALSAILTQGSFLEKNWRPIFMLICMIIIISSFFGYVPSHLNDQLSPMMEKIWTMLEIGLGGYLPLRTLEKIVQQINIGSILKALINKKVL